MPFKPLPHQRFPVMLTQGCVNARFHYSLLRRKHVFGHIPELWLWKHVNVKPSAAFQKALPADESGSNTSFGSGLSAGISKWSSRHSATRQQPVPVSNWELCVMLDVIRERQRTVILHRDSRQSPTIGSLISSAQAPAFKRDLHLLCPAKLKRTGRCPCVLDLWKRSDCWGVGVPWVAYVCYWTITIESIKVRMDLIGMILVVFSKCNSRTVALDRKKHGKIGFAPWPPSWCRFSKNVNISCNFSPFKGEIEFSFLLALYENVPTHSYSMLPFENVLPDRWQRLPSPFSELSAFKAGENEVGPRLHLPVRREAITALRVIYL